LFENGRKILDRESRIVHREMAAEWIKLAGDAADQDAASSSADDQSTKRTGHG
jgi:hypothetical protein